MPPRYNNINFQFYKNITVLTYQPLSNLILQVTSFGFVHALMLKLFISYLFHVYYWERSLLHSSGKGFLMLEIIQQTSTQNMIQVLPCSYPAFLAFSFPNTKGDLGIRLLQIRKANINCPCI